MFLSRILHTAAAEIAGMTAAFAATFVYSILHAAVAGSLSTSAPWVPSSIAVTLLESAAAASWVQTGSLSLCAETSSAVPSGWASSLVSSYLPSGTLASAAAAAVLALF